jgi:dCMP deaminase
MSEAVIAYVPVLHEGYRRFLNAHGRDRPLYLIGPELHHDYRPLAKDIRALDPQHAASAIAAWEICSAVEVLDVEAAERLASATPILTLPAEDISYALVERFFARCEVRYDTVFLRWDKTRTAALLEPSAPPATPADPQLAALEAAAREAADTSIDWWRQVGAAAKLADGTVRVAANEHRPHRLSAYAAGDPRANFFKGVALERSTAEHAEARLIAGAAREGVAMKDAVMYVTDFPCPPCAKLIAGAGIRRLYFRSGYAVLDGEHVLREAGVEVLQAG